MVCQMEDDDYKIAMTGPLYSKYSVSNRKFLTEVGELDEALQFVRDHMEKEQYWPNVWHINDHGNVDLMNVQTGDFIDNDEDTEERYYVYRTGYDVAQHRATGYEVVPASETDNKDSDLCYSGSHTLDEAQRIVTEMNKT